jgi:hypothetical protein
MILDKKSPTTSLQWRDEQVPMTITTDSQIQEKYDKERP